MKAYDGFKTEKPQYTEREYIPLGAYVCKILTAKAVTTQWGEKLVLEFDVAEGPYAKFFDKDFNAQGEKFRKWRGNIRLNVPAGDESEQDAKTKSIFQGNIWCIEDSNPGYHWNWDESSLVNKIVGVTFRNKEYDFNGHHGWTLEAGRLESANDVRNDKCKPMKDRPLKEGKASAKTADGAKGFVEVKEELPF